MSKKAIQEKAQDFIENNDILNILQKFGSVTIVGSFAMQIMTWNDLDFYIDLADFNEEAYYNLTAELIQKLKPIRYDGIFNEKNSTYFIGIETIFEGERWNIDIWWKTRKEIANYIQFCDNLIHQMKKKPHLRDAVFAIKQGLIAKKLYGFDKGRHHYHSNEIYDAVFNRGTLSYDDFIGQNKQFHFSYAKFQHIEQLNTIVGDGVLDVP